MRHVIESIATIKTPFKQKFAIPRQAVLTNAKGVIEFEPDYTDANILRGIEEYSHLWLCFLFHENLDAGWKPTVKAPRLGGNQKMGVLATRSTFRPNGMGMSVVKNKGVEFNKGTLKLHVEGVDLLDGTPIVDIKPYLPYADSLPTAEANWLNTTSVPQRSVSLSSKATQQLKSLRGAPSDLVPLLEGILAQDPRPAYKQSVENDDKIYAVQVYEYDVHWQVINGDVLVSSIEVTG